MSKLREKLKLKKCPVERVTIDGEVYIVTGLSLNATAKLTANCRSASTGKLNGDKLDRVLLEACVTDPEDGSALTADEWGDVPRSITGPLVSVILNLCGLDKEDIQRDPKDSGSTKT